MSDTCYLCGLSSGVLSGYSSGTVSHTNCAPVVEAALLAEREKSKRLDDIFRDLLDWFMVSDPSQIRQDTDERIRAFLDAEAKDRGFDGWVDAYHTVPKRAAIAEAGEGRPRVDMHPTQGKLRFEVEEEKP